MKTNTIAEHILFKSFIKDQRGNFALVIAVCAPILIGAVGLCLDYFLYFDQKSRLQQAADIAALASVKEISLAGTNFSKSNQLEEISTSYARAAYFKTPEEAASDINLSINSQPDLGNSEVVVELSYKWMPMFAQFFDAKVTPIVVSAKAKLAGDALTCVIGLMPPQTLAKASIHLDNNAVLKADGCGVFSNSTSKYGLRADGKASMTAQSICSAGGVLSFGKNSFIPTPISDCPKINDPLEDRSPPSYGNCTYTDLTISTNMELEPGVYCGGLKIISNASVALKPGVFVIKDGPLIVTDTASFIGKGVSFFLTGDKSIFEFHSDTTIDLAAMDSGGMAGLLFFEDREVKYSFEFNPLFLKSFPSDVRMHKISSNNARNLLGTLYLPRSILLIDANAPVADSSAYTAIVTGRLWLQKGPILTLNSDYTKTTVPVPNGLVGVESILVQ